MNWIVSTLRRYYYRVGHGGVKLALFLLFMLVNVCLTALVYLPSIDPNEFTAAAVANLMTGGDWSGAMSRNSYFYGFVQGIIYIPAMLLTRDPFLQYKLMIGTGGIFMSIVPILVYSICIRLGAKKPWQAGFAAICCGGYLTYFAHSKFIWNETLTVFLPWVVLWLIVCIATAPVAKKFARLCGSALLGFVCAVSYCAHERMIAMILAVAATVLIARIMLKNRGISLLGFFSSLAVFGTLAVLANYSMQQALWQVSDPAALQNTAENFLANAGALLNAEGLQKIFTALCGQIYYFFSATWGLGALAVSLFIAMLVRFFRDKKAKKENPFSDGFVMLGIFSALQLIFMLGVSVLYRVSSEQFGQTQNSILFGRYLDSVIPFALLFALMYILLFRLQLPHIFGGVLAQSAGLLLFIFGARSAVLAAESASIGAMLAIYPAMFGESTGSLIGSTGLLAAISCGYCVLALLVVTVSCARKNYSVIICFITSVITIYSCGYVFAYYLPLSARESKQGSAVYVEMSDKYIYNLAEAPSVTAYGMSRGAVSLLQYLNQNLTVYFAASPAEIEPNTFVIVPDGSQIRFSSSEKVSFTQIGRLEGFTIYAYGEKAHAYALSQK